MQRIVAVQEFTQSDKMTAGTALAPLFIISRDLIVLLHVLVSDPG